MTVQISKRKVWIRIFITLVPVILIIAAVSIIYLLRLSDNVTALTINGEIVSKAEFMSYMDCEKSKVYTYYAQKYNASDSLDFWQKSFGSEVPINTLKEETLKIVIKRKIEQIIFKENKLTDDISFDAFLNKLKAENKRRLRAANKGEPIYGPVQYEAVVYLDVLHGNYIEDIKNNNILDALTIDDNEIEEYYQKNKVFIFEGQEIEPIDHVRQQIKKIIMDEKFDELIKNRINNSSVSINENVLNSLFS